ncbi:hypothetical protein D0Z07_8749 [Hyphodiscus hymeniophilus]|uniref:BZIP domain-containing protein n=1 Tax=Hyphodiscus hymeniophilus TaxID=353542 RepID=A0A9P6VDV0_9HELO|nr:hypothetical protein D0Z07_8749 [Hyphodiscus hymeniophilus]
MPSVRSSSSPNATSLELEEPRKKGARGGKRSVTHLSKAQLARKRANDREAQRNIRQRTKEYIESLELKVKELERGSRDGSMERALARNRELEAEIEKLRSQVGVQPAPVIAAPVIAAPTDIPEELLIPQKVEMEWVPGANSKWPRSTLPSHIPELQAEATVSAPYTDDVPIYPTAPMNPSGYADDETEVGRQEYTQTDQTIPLWNDQLVFGPEVVQSQSLTKPTTAWTPFHPAFSQPSRFADLEQSGFEDVINNQNRSFPPTTSWQSQPSIYAWQMSTKLKPPATQIDHLMMSAIHSQRHMAITQGLAGEDLVGPDFPPVHVLFDQPGPAKPPTCLTEVMARYANVLSNRGFALIPEKLASFMCMYRFVQWQIDPTYATYQQLHDWQAPKPNQLEIAHPAWMDLPPWPKFREKVIRNQDRYDNVEFHTDYATSLNVNFPDPMEALIFEDDHIKVSVKLERHLSDIRNISMKKAFADKYPEFSDVCRFDEV